MRTWSGPELRKYRLIASVPVQVMAKELGVSRQTIWIIERRAVVSPETAARYLRVIEAKGGVKLMTFGPAPGRQHEHRY